MKEYSKNIEILLKGRTIILKEALQYFKNIPLPVIVEKQ